MSVLDDTRANNKVSFVLPRTDRTITPTRKYKKLRNLPISAAPMRLRWLLAIAAAHAAPREHTSVRPVGLVASTATAACSKCGLGGHGVLNCCSVGGSWEGTCKDSGSRTWEEGQFACVKKEVKATQQQRR